LAIIINEIRLPFTEDKNEAIKAAVKRINVKNNDIIDAYIVKASVDARNRNNICIVYSVGIELASGEEQTVKRAATSNVSLRTKNDYAPITGSTPLTHPPIIIGFGPAGMFSGLLLSRLGFNPIIIERGEDIDNRVKAVQDFWQNGVLNEQCNVQFGEGGAGTFSDGKLTTRINDHRCDMVLDEFVKHGAPLEIKKIAKPHIGTDKLRGIVKSIRQEIIQNGGQIRFNTTLDDIKINNGILKSVVLSDGSEICTNALLLCIGHSARDTFQMLLKRGVNITPKPFSVGVRIEHLQSEIDKALYGSLAGHPALPRGEYQLSHRQQNGKAVYTFCMCPGGTVVAAASESGGIVTNGMSYFNRDGKNANAALVVSVDSSDFGATPLAGMEFQRTLEQMAFKVAGNSYKAPFQTVSAFLNGASNFKTGAVQPSYIGGVTPYRLDIIFPEHISSMLKTGIQTFGKRLAGFDSDEAILTGVETRTSSPVRLQRNELFEAVNISGLYPVGEGAGYAGGIMSAAVDGLRVAEAIALKFASMK
jgi:uncharacterized FAD-dependent dehydrogenase